MYITGMYKYAKSLKKDEHDFPFQYECVKYNISGIYSRRGLYNQ